MLQGKVREIGRLEDYEKKKALFELKKAELEEIDERFA